MTGAATAPPALATALSPTSSFDCSTSLCTPPVRPPQATAPPPLNRRLSTSGLLTEQLLELADPPNKRLNFTFVSSSQPKSESKFEATSKSAIFSEPGLLQPRPKAPPADESAHIKLHQSSSSFLFQGDKVIGYYPQQQQQQQQQYQHQHQQFPRTINQFLHQLHPVNLSTKYGHLEESQPRKPLTSIAGSSRCLWPPDSAFWAVTGSLADERRSQLGPQQGSNVDGSISTENPRKAFNKNHERSDSFKDAAECIQALQPRRKARRVLDAPTFKEKNHGMVSGHVRKLIQEAVEDGVGELDLSYLDLDDLPAEIKDLNYAIVYNERGSFSLSKNRLKLFLSSNLFSTIPMDVFSLYNLSVLSLRNNNIEVIPPEIGLLHNLIELSVGGNHLEVPALI
ncbi:hypothetical protein BG000_011654 [Podila horticola]|nr:hypothetical protein BG000_011654 [Podila horticola]